MEFYISTTIDNGSGLEYHDKESFLKEISRMIDDCEANGGTRFDVEVNADASCFANEDD